jgi:DNA-binding response OmpR family regulator
MLRSLVNNIAVLSRPGLAFKFFLPREIGLELLAILGPRRDRFVVEEIEWEQRALLAMLEARITYYSNAHRTAMAQLCDAQANSILHKLYRAADDSPRALLRLCSHAVRVHVERTDTAQLQHQDINRAIGEYEHECGLEQLAVPSVATRDRPVAEAAPEAPARGLVVEGDHVWVDGQRIAGAFSPLEFDLLRTLYRANRAVVATDELIEAVYPSAAVTDDRKIRGQNEQNIRQLIARLRKELEPDATDGKWRFIQTERGRGYWLNPS